MGSEYLIAGPFDVVTAPEGTVYSDALLTDDSPTGWSILGNAEFDDEGATIENTEEYNEIRPNGRLQPIEVFRRLSDGVIRCNLLDHRADAVAMAIHGSTAGITTLGATNGRIGTRAVDLLADSHTVNKFAVALRGGAPYVDGLRTVFYAPRVYVMNGFSVQSRMAEPGPITFEFKILRHATIKPSIRWMTAGRTV